MRNQPAGRVPGPNARILRAAAGVRIEVAHFPQAGSKLTPRIHIPWVLGPKRVQSRTDMSRGSMFSEDSFGLPCSSLLTRLDRGHFGLASAHLVDG